MAEDSGHSYFIIMLTFFAAYVLAVLPLPAWLASWRPEWVAMVLIYWCMALPQRVGIASALLAGIGLDVLEGALLGQNALALVLLSLLSLMLYQRVRLYGPWQQAGVVFVLAGVNQLICQWVQSLEGMGASSLAFLVPALSSALLWPPLFLLMRGLRRHYRVS